MIIEIFSNGMQNMLISRTNTLSNNLFWVFHNIKSEMIIFESESGQKDKIRVRKMKTFALKTRKRSVVKTMSSKSAKQQKALEQARSKLEDLTRKDVVSFSFILSEEGVELCGEEQLTVDMMNLLEESGMIKVAQRIRMQGRVLHHRSTRQIKIEKLQDAFDTRLPPTLYPLQNMKDYDLLRSLLNDVMKVEGLGRLWQPGDNPPESVQHWWGPDDWDLFRM